MNQGTCPELAKEVRLMNSKSYFASHMHYTFDIHRDPLYFTLQYRCHRCIHGRDKCRDASFGMNRGTCPERVKEVIVMISKLYFAAHMHYTLDFHHVPL